MRHPVSRTNFICFISRLKFALLAITTLHTSVPHHFPHDLIISHSFTFSLQTKTHLFSQAVAMDYLSHWLTGLTFFFRITFARPFLL